MSEDEKSPEKSDGLECFNFQLLLDDFNSSHQKQRKASAHEAHDEYFKEYEGNLKDNEKHRKYSFVEDFEKLSRKNHYKLSEDNINTVFDEHPIGILRTEKPLGFSETKSACQEPRRSYNIWSGQWGAKNDALRAHFTNKLEESTRKTTVYANSDAKFIKRKESEDLNFAGPATDKKKSLRSARRDGFYPKEAQSYRKLSYQETTMSTITRGAIDETPLDIRVKLNLNNLTFCDVAFGIQSNGSNQKLARYVQNDLPSLLQMIETRLDVKIKSQNCDEFPPLATKLSDD